MDESGRSNDAVKSITHIGPQNKLSNIDVQAKKRQWEQEKRSTLISADAS